MAPKYHPSPLSGGDRKALNKELGKPSVFDKRKDFILEKVDQARTLAERVTNEPKGTNFDVTWAKSVEWRVVSPFVEFAWRIDKRFMTKRDCHVCFRFKNCWAI